MVNGRCTKLDGPFRVSWEVPTNFGFEKKQIKIFDSLPKANSEFKKRFQEFKRDISRGDFESDEGLILEDISKDLRLQARIVDDDGKINDFGGMR